MPGLLQSWAHSSSVTQPCWEVSLSPGQGAQGLERLLLHQRLLGLIPRQEHLPGFDPWPW